MHPWTARGLRGIFWPLLLCALLAAQGRVVDQLAAVVNGAPILQSEVEDAAWWARLAGAGSAAADPLPLTDAEYQAALRREIDQRLLLQEAADQGYSTASDAEVAAQWAHIEAAAGGAGALADRLPRFHLDPDGARAQLQRQLTILDFLDRQLGGGAVDEAQIESYYTAEFAPLAKAKGIAPAPLAAARPQIEEILRQRQIAAAQQALLDRLRQAAKITIEPAPAAKGSG